MSMLSYPSAPLTRIREHRLLTVAALLALIATSAVVLALAIGHDTSTTSTVDKPEAAIRADGGPEETGVAAAVAGQPTVAGPDESRIASAIGSGRESAPTVPRPDESAVAAAVSGH
jgi:hypothetical protein